MFSPAKIQSMCADINRNNRHFPEQSQKTYRSSLLKAIKLEVKLEVILCSCNELANIVSARLIVVQIIASPSLESKKKAVPGCESLSDISPHGFF